MSGYYNDAPMRLDLLTLERRIAEMEARYEILDARFNDLWAEHIGAFTSPKDWTPVPTEDSLRKMLQRIEKLLIDVARKLDA